MSYTTQRVETLKEQFMEFYDEGYNIAEIAEKFNVSRTTVYKYLGEIAAANNVSRESLLERASSEHITSAASFHRDKVNIDHLKSEFRALDVHLESVISSLTEIIDEI